MKIELVGSPKVIMSNYNSKHNYFGWPSVIRLDNGKIVVGASGYRLEHICPFGKGVIAFSDNNGETFTSPAPIIDTCLDDRDVGLCKFGDGGVIVTSFNNTRKMQRSHNEDNNPLMKAYINAYLDLISDEDENAVIGSTFRVSLDGGVTFGEIYRCPVTSPHGPVQISDGRILWMGYVFNTEDRADDFCEHLELYEINVENGECNYIARVPDIYENGNRITPSEPYMIELDDGTLLCHIRSEENFSTYQTVSTDKGITWSVPRKLLSDFGGAPCHIIKHTSGLLCSLYGYRQEPFEIRAMFSSDNGENWDTDHTVYVNGISDDIGYPCTVELDDSTLLTVFYAKENNEESPCVIMMQKWKIDE